MNPSFLRVKRYLSLCFFLAGGLSALGASAQELKTDSEKYSHLLGYQIGGAIVQKLVAQPNKIDLDILIAGIGAAIKGEEIAVSRDEIMAVMKRLEASGQENSASLGKANSEAGAKFLKENAQRDSVIVLDSGLQYEILTDSDGARAQPGTKVVFHYRGTLLDGEEFDSSYARGKPVELATNATIPGFREALELMKEGSKWKVYVPENLAYGAKGVGERIGANATLIFELELKKVLHPRE